MVDQLNEVFELVAYRGQLTSTSQIDLMQENIVYANSNLSDEGIGQFYSSTISGNQLTASFSDGAGGVCDFTMTLPTGATFGFEDIISFNQVLPSTANCNNNFDFDAEITYIDCGVITTGSIEVSNTCFEVNVCVCGDEGQILCDDPYNASTEVCYQPTLDQLYQLTIEQYEQNVTNQYAYYIENYKSTCAEAFNTEDFSYDGPDRYYQYTLFYYDQSGNLVQTVAPEGVDLLANSNNTAIDAHRHQVVNSSSSSAPVPGTTIPEHEFKTSYEYNSYGQLTSTTNPDQEGETNFWYDRYGRIIASQNPVQADELVYSYSLYDKQGRPVEVGQVSRKNKDGQILISPFTEADIKQDDLGVWFKNWVYAGIRSEVTITTYDLYPDALTAPKFKKAPVTSYLRLRVSAVRYYAGISGSTNYDTDYESANYYSYDIHGNVLENIQDVPELAVVEQDIKSTQYEFELISGNVKNVNYQVDEADYMQHEYVYDELNRLTEVFSTTDDLHSSREAHYHYYDYGPLARTELGQYKIQGQDFAYTINGWLKAMNGSTLSSANDIGKDGLNGYLGGNTSAHSRVARDVNAYTIGYFDGDYSSIGNIPFEISSVATDAFRTTSDDLYNGNIRHLVTSIYDMETMGTAYSYDQLQRLTDMTAFYNTNTNNTWTGINPTQDYYNAYTYDKNGNIKTLQRNGTSAGELLMDDLEYSYVGLDGLVNYDPVTGAPISASPSNRLDHVVDDGIDYRTDPSNPLANDYGDIISGVDQNNNVYLSEIEQNGNFKYDKIGQLVEDKSEEIYSIVWRKGDKKMLSLTRSPSSTLPDLEFVYNPFGVRVLKIEKTKSSPGFYAPEEDWNRTYYAYDANGQCMAVYDIEKSQSNNQARIEEHHLYGASRLGMIKHGDLIYDNGNAIPASSDVVQNTLGEKRYELVNHLGNVQAVVTDRKTWNTADLNFEAAVVMTSDYYPFGMQMPGGLKDGAQPTNVVGGYAVYASSDYADRINGDYRYAYNGMEVDNEVSGNGNSYTTEFRQYDPRLGRWKSLDPLMHIFPSMSPYNAFANNPIFFTDPLGLAPGGPGDGKCDDCGSDTPGSSTENNGWDGDWIAVDPDNFGGRPLNPNINGGNGIPSMAGQYGIGSGRRFLFADETIKDKQYVSKSHSTIWSIAQAHKRSTAQIRSWNDGLAKEDGNDETIGQGQVIYIDPPVKHMKNHSPTVTPDPTFGIQDATDQKDVREQIKEALVYALKTPVATYIQTEIEGTFDGDAAGVIIWNPVFYGFKWDGYTMESEGVRSEIISGGFEGGIVLTTGGNAGKVTLDDFAGVSWSTDINVSAGIVDIGVSISWSDEIKGSDGTKFRLILIGGQVTGGIGTPIVSGGDKTNNTTPSDW